MKKDSALRACRRPRGFTLIEIIATLVLLAVFMVVISALFKAAYLGHANSTKRDALIHRVDAAMGVLRRDVWGARSLSLDGGKLTLAGAGYSALVWDFSANDRIARTTDDRSTTWNDLPRANVVLNGPLVTLIFDTRERETITFASQVMLAAASGGGTDAK